MKENLSEDAKKMLQIFCRFDRGETVPTDELKGIAPEALHELNEGGYIKLHAKVVGADPSADKLWVGQNGISLTPTGKEYCGKPADEK